MTNRIDAARLQPMLLGVAIVAALLAAVALLLSGRATQQQAQLREHLTSLTAIAQNIPLQAGAAVRGSAPAFDALAASRTRLERVIDEIDAGKSAVGLLSSPSARVLGSERGWPALLEQSQAVLEGQGCRAAGAGFCRECARVHAPVAVHGSRRAEGDGPRPSRCRESQLRAFRAARAGDRPGPHCACRWHGFSRGGVASPHRQPRIHGAGHCWRERPGQHTWNRCGSRRCGRRCEGAGDCVRHRSCAGSSSDRARRPARTDAGGAQRAD
ncbi:MAG: hypothetical protein IPJ97_00400 [Proteobacteria bacterium]|nr:hypothetical protein [Pseudomonadota bacterium]